MPRKPREKRRLTPEDIEYVILREWVEDGYKCGEIRNKKSGATAICRIPIRTPEEDRKALEPFVRAACRICNPNVEELGVCTFINDLHYSPEELYPPEELKRRGLA